MCQHNRKLTLAHIDNNELVEFEKNSAELIAEMEKDPVGLCPVLYNSVFEFLKDRVLKHLCCLNEEKCRPGVSILSLYTDLFDQDPELTSAVRSCYHPRDRPDRRIDDHEL